MIMFSYKSEHYLPRKAWLSNEKITLVTGIYSQKKYRKHFQAHPLSSKFEAKLTRILDKHKSYLNEISKFAKFAREIWVQLLLRLWSVRI